MLSGGFNLYQQVESSQARDAADRAQNAADKSSSEIATLKSKMDRLTLASQALFEILRDSGLCPQDKLLAKMQDIDMRDGIKDGKITRTVKICPRCGRNSNNKRLECVYCGEPLPSPNIFDAQ